MLAKPDRPKNLKICRMGKSLYVTIPADYARTHTLNQHDDVYWLPEPDGIKLKFPTVQDGEAA
jgi:hypothetical protein